MDILYKIKAWHSHRFLAVVQNINLLLVPLAVYFLITEFTWFYAVSSIMSLLLITKVGHCVGQHRYFCHRSFSTDTPREWVLALFATLCTTHTPIYYSAVHRYHHGHSDTDLDPHDPSQLGYLSAFFGKMNQKNTAQIPKTIIRDLLKKPSVMFFHNWYWPVIFGYCLILILIDPLLLMFCYILPSGYTRFITGTQVSLGHGRGYRNFETCDHSVNNRFWNFISLGEGLHNNHHARPSHYDFGFTNQPGEWDLAKWIVEKFLLVSASTAKN